MAEDDELLNEDTVPSPYVPNPQIQNNEPYIIPDPVDQALEIPEYGVSADRNPDSEGALIDLSKQARVDREALRSQAKPFLDALQSRPTRQAALERDRDLAQWMVDHPDTALLSQDDMPQIEAIKQHMPFWATLGGGARLPTIGQKFDATLEDTASFLTAGLGGISRSAYGLLQMGADAVGADSLANYAADKAEIGANLNAHLETVITDHNLDEAIQRQRQQAQWSSLSNLLGTDISAKDIGAAFVSMLPALAAAPFGIAGAAVAAAGQTTGGAYADLRERGESGGKAGAIALAEGFITGTLTKFIPGAERTLVNLLRSSTTPTATARALFAKALGRTAAGEFTEEGLDQFAQTLINDSTDTKNPKDWNFVLRHAVREGLKAGLIGGLVGGTVGFGGARQEAMLERAENFHKQNSELATLITGSKTATRSKVVMEELLQGNGMRGAMIHVTGEEVAPMLKGSSEQVQALAQLGITPETVQRARSSGGTIALTASQVHTAEAGIRDQILEIGRETPHSPNKAEVDQARTDGTKEIVTAEQKKIKEFSAELKKQEQRLVKEAAAAGGVDEKTVRAEHAPLFAMAKAMFLRNPLAAKSPIEFLKKIRYNKVGLTREEAMQAITDLAGPEGKTALSRVAFKDLGQLSGRFDALTGQLDVNEKALPDTVALAELVSTAKKSTIDLTGKTVSIPDATGSRATVDAEAAVSTLRQRANDARRLTDCLG